MPIAPVVLTVIAPQIVAVPPVAATVIGQLPLVAPWSVTLLKFGVDVYAGCTQVPLLHVHQLPLLSSTVEAQRIAAIAGRITDAATESREWLCMGATSKSEK